MRALRLLAALVATLLAALVAVPAYATAGPADPDAPLPEEWQGEDSQTETFAISCMNVHLDAPLNPACEPYVVTNDDGDVVGVQIGEETWGEVPGQPTEEEASEDDCAALDVVCRVAEATAGALEKAALSVAEFAGETLATVGTLWVEIPVPQLTVQQPEQAHHAVTPEPADEIKRVQDPLQWYVLAIAVLCVLVGAGRIMISRRGEDLRSLLHGVVLMTVVSASGIFVVDLLIQASDGFANWLLSPTGPLQENRDFGENLFSMFSGVVGPAADKLPAPYDSYASSYASAESMWLSTFGIILGGIILLLMSLVQAILMIGRSAILVVMAVMLPLVAAAAISGTGRQWLGKYAKWILALILYKPVAAIIYATAFSLLDTSAYSMGDTQTAILNVIMGFTLMGLALVALPALLRVIAPATSSVAGGGGAGGLIAGGVMAGAVGLAGVGAAAPTGAAAASGGMASSGGMAASQGGGAAAASGTAGSAGPQGAAGAGASPGGASPGGSGGQSGAPGAPGPSGSAGEQGGVPGPSPGGSSAGSSPADSPGGSAPSGAGGGSMRPADGFAAGQHLSSSTEDSIDSEGSGE